MPSEVKSLISAVLALGGRASLCLPLGIGYAPMLAENLSVVGRKVDPDIVQKTRYTFQVVQLFACEDKRMKKCLFQ